MNALPLSPRGAREAPSLLRWNVRGLMLLVLLAAVAADQIRDQRRTEPALIALASAGFVAYGLIGRWGWIRATRHLEPRVGKTASLAAFLAFLALLFLVATWIYLALESAYLAGRLA